MLRITQSLVSAKLLKSYSLQILKQIIINKGSNRYVLSTREAQSILYLYCSVAGGTDMKLPAGTLCSLPNFFPDEFLYL